MERESAGRDGGIAMERETDMDWGGRVG